MTENENTVKTAWKFFLSGSEAHEAMLGAVQKAETSIEFEQYIFENDKIGTLFLEALIERSQQGLQVRLLCDQVGSFYLFTSSWPDKLREAGVEVRFFNTVGPWRIRSFTSWYFRDHRKLCTIDDSVAFIGGIDIADYMKNWRDSHLQIGGEIARTMRENFDEMWKKSKHRILFSFKKQKIFSKKFEFLTNAPFFRRRYIYHTLVEAVQNAKQSILLTTPYFVPDRRFFRALRLASKRSVEVKLIIPAHPDVKWVNIAAHSYIERMLKSGIRVFKYQKGVLHAKTAVIDGNFSTVGSLNLDNLSFLWNYEANVTSADISFASMLETHFADDLRDSREILLPEWQKRPIFDRILEYISLPIHRFL